ncbi:unnamed protein product [Cuscuta campestris]|uniref:Uncharacterized protein n=1 Tax=Cuscuta campestris TaxID=132261 RepID=A0A484M763_9ASTE|nr:unnamed protein product [Cuscuta campestris]
MYTSQIPKESNHGEKKGGEELLEAMCLVIMAWFLSFVLELGALDLLRVSLPTEGGGKGGNSSIANRVDSQNPSIHSYGSGGRSPTFGSSSSSSSDSEHPATSPQKKPVDASTCAPSSSVAQVVSVAQPGDEGFIQLDDRLLQEQPLYMQKPQVHELRNLMPDGYQLTYRATWKSIIPLHVGTSIGIHYHSIKDLGEFSIHPFKVLFLETYGIMPGQLAPNGHRLLGSFINEATLWAGDASTRGLYHVGKWSVYPGRETDPEPEIVLPGAIPEAIPIRQAGGPKAPAAATAGPSRPARKKKEKVVKFQSKFAIPQIVVEEPSTAQSLNASSSQPFLLDEQPAQSHQGTNQPIHSGEIYFNVGRIGEEYFARLVKSMDEEKARMEAMMVECRKEAQAARAKADKIEAKWTEHWVIYRQLYAKHDGLLKAAKEADEIGTYGFESGQYSERKALYGILEQRIQGFQPKALSLPELHDEVPVPPFPGI